MDTVNQMLSEVSLRSLAIISYDLVERDFQRLLKVLEKQRCLEMLNMKITSATQIDKIMLALSKLKTVHKLVFHIPKKTSMKYVQESLTKAIKARPQTVISTESI